MIIGNLWTWIRNRRSCWKKPIRVLSAAVRTWMQSNKPVYVNWTVRYPCFSWHSDRICWRKQTLSNWLLRIKTTLPACPKAWYWTRRLLPVRQGWKANGFSLCIIRAWCLSCNMPITVRCVKRFSKVISTVEIMAMMPITKMSCLNWLRFAWKKRSWWDMTIMPLSSWKTVWQKRRIKYMLCWTKYGNLPWGKRKKNWLISMPK